MMVAIGYSEIAGERYVMIPDPWPPNEGSGNQLIPYDAYVNPSDGTHWRDYYSIERTVFGAAPSPRGGEAPGSDDGPGERKSAVRNSQDAARRGIAVMWGATGTDLPGVGERKIDVSIPVVHVGLNELLFEGPGGSESILDKATAKVVHIVETPDRRMTAIVTQPAPDAPGGWKATSLGNDALANMITSAERAHSASARGPRPDYVAVEAPALGLYFLAYKSPGGSKFIPTIEDRQLGLLLGKEESESVIRSLMQRLARQHNKEPS